MFKLTFPNGSSVLVEKPDFVRVHKNNCFILCERKKAEGVAYKGSPFLFADGLQCHEVDAGDEFKALQAENEALRAASEDSDAMHVDHEYRLTLLELGLTE